METFFISFLSVASLQFLALISPGPDFALVTRNALLHPRREAVCTALGIAMGLTVHISYCILGLAVVIGHSLRMFDFIKYLGATYIVYLGIKTWRAQPDGPVAAQQSVGTMTSTITPLQAVLQGFLCNVLNVKASLFFIGLFSLVIKPSIPIWQQGIFGLWMVVITFAWFSFVACLITEPHIRHTVAGVQRIVLKSLSVMLMILGISLLFVSWHGASPA